MRETAAVLSPPVTMVVYAAGKVEAIVSKWVIMPACLQVTVRYGAVGVVKGNKKFLHLARERMPPDVALFIGIEENSTHTSFGCISRARKGRILGNNLSEMSWPILKVVHELMEGCEMVSNVLGDAHAIVVGIVKSVLKGAEYSDRARNGWTHESELSDDTMPFLLGHPALAFNRGENC